MLNYIMILYMVYHKHVLLYCITVWCIYIYMYMCVYYLCYIYTYYMYITYTVYIYILYPSSPCVQTAEPATCLRTYPSRFCSVKNAAVIKPRPWRTERPAHAAQLHSEQWQKLPQTCGPPRPLRNQKKEFKPVQIRGFEQGSTLHLKPFQLQFPLNNKLLIQLTNSRYKSTELHVLGRSIPRSPPAKARQGPQ